MAEQNGTTGKVPDETATTTAEKGTDIEQPVDIKGKGKAISQPEDIGMDDDDDDESEEEIVCNQFTFNLINC